MVRFDNILPILYSYLEFKITEGVEAWPVLQN